MNKNITIFVIISTILITSALPTDKKSEKLKTIGPCINNFCPLNYKCDNGKCIEDEINLKNLTTEESIGPCINGLCPGNHACYSKLCYNMNRLTSVSS
ncbi:Low-density lipoprotein receptor-related protein [Dirofilaria immitis]